MNLAEFSRALEVEYQAKVIEPVVALHRALVEEIYDGVIDLANAAMYSGYYRSNNRVGIGGPRNAELNPPQRPAFPEPLEFLDNIGPTRSLELSKLRELRPFQRVVLGTAVPYAPILEARDATYARGIAEGVERALARFAAMRFERRAPPGQQLPAVAAGT